jgi:two-component system LytT family response regulator
MNVIIVDDEPLARLALSSILKDYFKQINIVGECNNIPEAVIMINSKKPDVVFLDVEMPEYNGFDLLNFFPKGQIDFQIIFVTAFSEYALQAFQISAVDYLLKPINIEQIQRALHKISLKPTPQIYTTLQENLQNPQEKKIVLQTADNIFLVKLNEIICLQAEGSYTKFILTNQPPILISKTLSEFEYLEKTGLFFRSNRSFLVNIQKIKKIDKKELQMEMENGIKADISQEKKNILIEKLASSK